MGAPSTRTAVSALVSENPRISAMAATGSSDCSRYLSARSAREQATSVSLFLE